MITQHGTRLIPLDAIDVVGRYRSPTDDEVERMTETIENDGLLQPIGVVTKGDRYRLVYGATRLRAFESLGRIEIEAVVLEGPAEELVDAEILENLKRRHLAVDERDALLKALLERRAGQEGNKEEFSDDASPKSSPGSRSHPKKKVEGAKPGRPRTPEGQAKKEIAEETGMSLRVVQRATSSAPKKRSESIAVLADRKNLARMKPFDDVKVHIRAISELLSLLDRADREMIRKNSRPFLDGWYDSQGKLITGEAVGKPADPAARDDASLQEEPGRATTQADADREDCNRSTALAGPEPGGAEAEPDAETAVGVRSDGGAVNTGCDGAREKRDSSAPSGDAEVLAFPKQPSSLKVWYTP
jgi:ParB-like chromosome segregation protein Spo0J